MHDSRHPPAPAAASDKGLGLHRGAVLAVAAALIGVMTTMSGVVIELASDLAADMRHGVCVMRVPGDTRPLYSSPLMSWRPYDRTRCCGGSAFVDHGTQECKTRSIISHSTRKRIAAPSATALPFGWKADEEPDPASSPELALTAQGVALSAGGRRAGKALGGATSHLGVGGGAADIALQGDEVNSLESEWRSWGRWLAKADSHEHRAKSGHLRERVGSDATEVRSHISHAFSSDAAESWGEEAVDRFTSLAEQAEELAVNADVVQTHSESAGSLAPFYEWVPWDRALMITGRPVALVIYVFGCGCFALCAALITRWQVPAKGSGIPEVKASVAGFAIPKSFQARTLAAKVMALSLCVGAGLAVGKEGPMIHIGACWGVLLAGPITRIARLAVPIDETELICVGAAAGVSAAFGAPLGGVLFGLEELGTTLPSGLRYSTMLAAFGSAVAAALALKWMDLTRTQRLTLFEVDYKETWAPWEALPFCLLGACGGIVGGAFVLLNGAVQRRRLRAQAEGRLHWSLRTDVDRMLQRLLGLRGADTRVLEVLVLAVLTGVSNYPHMITRILQGDAIKAMFSQCPASAAEADDNPDPDQLPYDDPIGLCGIRSLEALTSFLELLFSAGALRFFQAAVTFGALTPAGLFVPSLFVGGCIGRAFGEVLQFAGFTSGRGVVEPGIYAMVGAGAVLAGVSRITLSLVVILFELTGGLTYVVPFMLAVLTAKWTGDWMTNGMSVYDVHTELNGYAKVEQVEEVRLPNVTLQDLCDQVPARASAADAEVPELTAVAEDSPTARAPVPLWTANGTVSGGDLLARCGDSGFPVLSLTCHGDVEVLGWVHAHRLALGLRAAEAAAEAEDTTPVGAASQLLFQLCSGPQRAAPTTVKKSSGDPPVDFSGILEPRGVVRVRADCPLQTIYCIFETCPNVHAVVSVEDAPLAVRALTRSLFLTHVMPAAERPRAPMAVWPADLRGGKSV